MKMKSQIVIAGLMFAGVLVSGCSQQQAAGSQQQQQVAEPAPVVTPAPAPAPVVQQAPVVPKVKAKGNYKGAVMMDPASAAAMQQYQK